MCLSGAQAPDTSYEVQAEVAANAQPPPRQGTKVSQKKVDQVKVKHAVVSLVVAGRIVAQYAATKAMDALHTPIAHVAS